MRRLFFMRTVYHIGTLTRSGDREALDTGQTRALRNSGAPAATGTLRESCARYATVP